MVCFSKTPFLTHVHIPLWGANCTINDIWVHKSFVKLLKYRWKGHTQQLVAFMPPHCCEGVVSLKGKAMQINFITTMMWKGKSLTMSRKDILGSHRERKTEQDEAQSVWEPGPISTYLHLNPRLIANFSVLLDLWYHLSTETQKKYLVQLCCLSNKLYIPWRWYYVTTTDKILSVQEVPHVAVQPRQLAWSGNTHHEVVPDKAECLSQCPAKLAWLSSTGAAQGTPVHRSENTNKYPAQHPTTLLTLLVSARGKTHRWLQTTPADTKSA